MRSFLVAAMAIAVSGAGCVDTGPGPQPKRVEPGYVPKHLLSSVPTLTEKLDVEIGGKVVYLGNNVGSARIIPGQLVKITHYWKVLASPGEGWKVFTLLRGAPNTPDFMNLAETDMQRAHGPRTWKTGEIIEDEQEFILRPDWRSVTATLHVGLIQTGEHGVGDRMAASGPRVQDRAVVARTFEIDVSRAPPPPGTIHIPYALGAIAIDGTPADVGWNNALQSPDLVAAEGSPEPLGKATAKIAWTAEALYVYVTIADTDIFSEFKNQDDPLWKADCIEMFIDADNNKRGYIELQVNPNNATFDSWFPQGRAAKGDEAWDSNMVTAVKVRGTADKAGDSDQGWDVEIAIPWAAIKGKDDAMQVRLPPQVGDRWRLNLVRVDKRSGATNPAAASWNRITYADWHGLDRMLTVVFADQQGGVVPGTPVPASFADPAAGSGSGAGSGSAAAPPPGAGSGAALVPSMRTGAPINVEMNAGSGSATTKILTGTPPTATTKPGAATPPATTTKPTTTTPSTTKPPTTPPSTTTKPPTTTPTTTKPPTTSPSTATKPAPTPPSTTTKPAGATPPATTKPAGAMPPATTKPAPATPSTTTKPAPVTAPSSGSAATP